MVYHLCHTLKVSWIPLVNCSKSEYSYVSYILSLSLGLLSQARDPLEALACSMATAPNRLVGDMQMLAAGEEINNHH